MGLIFCENLSLKKFESCNSISEICTTGIYPFAIENVAMYVASWGGGGNLANTFSMRNGHNFTDIYLQHTSLNLEYHFYIMVYSHTSNLKVKNIYIKNY